MAGRKTDAVPFEEQEAKASFDCLDSDSLELVAKLCGADLPAFASVSKSVAAVVRPTMWRQAYECASPAFDSEGWGGDMMAPGLWRACLLRRSK